MDKRIVCLLLAVVLMVVTVFGLRAMAVGTQPVKGTSGTARLGTSHRPNPLASAMLLVLAGVSISMLFDKKD